MKKLISVMAIASLLLCGCGKKENVEVKNPYEIKVGNKILSYYDDKSKFEDAGLLAGEWSPMNGFGVKGEFDAGASVNDAGEVRSIIVEDEDVITYKGISVGDDAEEIEKVFKYEEDGRASSSITVFFYDGQEISLKKFHEKHRPIDDDYGEALDGLVGIYYRIDDKNEIETIWISDYDGIVLGQL